MFKFALLVPASLAVLLITGCTNLSTVEHAPESAGTTRVFRAQQSAVVAAARGALADVGFPIKDERPYRRGTIILATHGAGDLRPDWTDGYVARLTIEPCPTGTSVRVICEYAYKLIEMTSADRTEEILTRTGQRLGEYPQ